MRTNVNLDDRLVEEAMRLTRAKTKKEVIHQALVELVERRKRKNLLEIEGQITFAEGYDHKKLREGR